MQRAVTSVCDHRTHFVILSVITDNVYTSYGSANIMEIHVQLDIELISDYET